MHFTSKRAVSRHTVSYAVCVPRFILLKVPRGLLCRRSAVTFVLDLYVSFVRLLMGRTGQMGRLSWTGVLISCAPRCTIRCGYVLIHCICSVSGLSPDTYPVYLVCIHRIRPGYGGYGLYPPLVQIRWIRIVHLDRDFFRSQTTFIRILPVAVTQLLGV